MPDTIAAVATPPGRGGVAIVRISGSLVKRIILTLFHRELSPRQALYLPFCDDTNEVIDEGIALYFPNPHSFTGEDVLELHGHGGPVVVSMLLERVIALGARLARPGEFSERAFLNGKLDLAQAEAIADLIDASSRQAARLAMRSLQGDFSKAIHAVCETIIRVRMYVEAAIDFSDEEIDFLADEKIKTDLEVIVKQLDSIQSKAKQGSLLREGITVVIAGEPNVGKSSLLNVLSGKETAIVTDIPGTTRDVLRDYLVIDGMPVHVIDTAGLRESDDVVEQEGIRRAHREIEKADLVLYVTDATRSSDVILAAWSPPVIIVRNKIDLAAMQPKIEIHDDQTVIALSAKSGEGLDLLKQHIKAQMGIQDQVEGIYLARHRHLDALRRANTFVGTALQQWQAPSVAGELVADDLRLAQSALSEITGEFTADDLLGRIFSNFCIGK